MQGNTQRISIAYGDGIGPEIMTATLSILKAAEVPLEYDEIEIGEKVYLSGIESGIAEESWNVLRKNKVFLKAPITTPQGGGYKSLNVTVRKSLGLYANVRPCVAYTPFIRSNHGKMDMVIVRENEEDLYAGIEYQQTTEVMETLKLVSKPGSEKIIRYAFEYARVFGRKKVTCMSKDNIMKFSDGMFHSIFNEVAKEYPEIESNHWIIDIGSAIVANRPETLDVVVTLNLYGDIISDIASEVAGSVGLGGSSNVGDEVSMFEAIHGSAPDIAGKNMANPSGLLNAAVMMLVELGLGEKAALIKNAWLRTLEEGYHTGEIYSEEHSIAKVGTKEFAEHVIFNLGKTPLRFPVASFGEGHTINVQLTPTKKQDKKLVGIDVFLDWDEASRNPNTLGHQIEALQLSPLALSDISNRGVKVYPGGQKETFCTDHWRCRFTATEPISKQDLLDVLSKLEEAGMDTIKTENLYEFDGNRGYSLGQGS